MTSNKMCILKTNQPHTNIWTCMSEYRYKRKNFHIKILFYCMIHLHTFIYFKNWLQFNGSLRILKYHVTKLWRNKPKRIDLSFHLGSLRFLSSLSLVSTYSIDIKLLLKFTWPLSPCTFTLSPFKFIFESPNLSMVIDI